MTTKYKPFKLDKYITFLAPPYSTILKYIIEIPGITFEELLKKNKVGPKYLKRILKALFERDYIITEKQIENIKRSLECPMK